MSDGHSARGESAHFLSDTGVRVNRAQTDDDSSGSSSPPCRRWEACTKSSSTLPVWTTSTAATAPCRSERDAALNRTLAGVGAVCVTSCSVH